MPWPLALGLVALVIANIALWLLLQRARASSASALPGSSDTLDPATQLQTRSTFERTLADALAGAGSTAECGLLAILDIRDFHRINAALGHKHADRLLQQLAERLRQALPANTPIARLSGDVFGVLLQDAFGCDTAVAARRLLSSVEAPFDLNGVPVEIEAYCGMAVFPKHGNTSALLLQHAEVAVRAAKDQGELVGVYTASDESQAARRVQMFGALRLALQRSELSLRYQPKLQLDSGAIVGCEALLSWHSPQLGSISPGEFIPLAEQTSLIKPLTSWVLEHAIEQLALWRAEGIHTRVAVNLSAKNLVDPTLPTEIERMLRERGVPAQSLIAEVTESAVLVNPERAANVIEQLSQLGVVLSLDDFGTGYSSLTYVRLLPAAELKLDRSFVADVDTNPGNASIVRSITQLAHELDMRVVAEGVETQAAAQRVRELGCDIVQGYLVSRPLLAADFADFFRARRAGSLELAVPKRVAIAPLLTPSGRPPRQASLRDSLRRLRLPLVLRSEPPSA